MGRECQACGQNDRNDGASPWTHCDCGNSWYCEPVPEWADVRKETAYDRESNLSFAVRVF